jgi:hypothetical protein
MGHLPTFIYLKICSIQVVTVCRDVGSKRFLGATKCVGFDIIQRDAGKYPGGIAEGDG